MAHLSYRGLGFCIQHHEYIILYIHDVEYDKWSDFTRQILSSRDVAYLSPLTYAQDLMNFEALGVGLLKPWLDLGTLPLTIVLFLQPSIKLHQRSCVLGF